MSTSNVLLLIVLASLLACGPATRPDPGFGDDAGHDSAVAQGDGGRDAGRDSGHDAGRDGGRDAGRDAEPDDGAVDDDAGLACADACEGPTPVCDRKLGECAECTRDRHCAPSGYCSDAGECVECTEDAHCTDPAESHCKLTTHRCFSCEAPAHCAHLPATPYCNIDIGCGECEPASELTDCAAPTPRCDAPTSTCGECSPATEAMDCGVYSCDRTTLECTAVPRGSLLACASCQSDSECATGMACVEHMFGSASSAVSLGRFCFPKKGTIGCGNTEPTRRPYSQEVVATSVGGETTTYCLPRTSCVAIADATLQTSCLNGAIPDETLCGVPNVEDGACLTTGPATGKCSYVCNSDFECLQSGLTDCSGTGGKCIP